MKDVTLGDGSQFTIYTPLELKAYLDRHVIGQEEAKRVISVAVYNHYKRIYMAEACPGITIDKSNILMAGPTGCGKTHIVRSIAAYMGVPYYVADCTSLTQAGYVGDDVESVLAGLLRAAQGNVELAQHGIVFLDEVDKIAKRSSSDHITRDVVGEGVQQGLLKMVEGSVVGVPPNGGRKRPDQELLQMDTRNILFIASGAFSGIEGMVQRRLSDSKQEPGAGIGRPFEYLSQEDLKSFGMIPEFVGRFPVITTLNKLSVEALADIMVKPQNAILKQYAAMFEVEGITLDFTDGALDEMAHIAYNIGTGARAIRSVAECLMNEYTFALSGKEEKRTLTIGRQDVRRLLSKRYSMYMDKAPAENCCDDSTSAVPQAGAGYDPAKTSVAASPRVSWNLVPAGVKDVRAYCREMNGRLFKLTHYKALNTKKDIYMVKPEDVCRWVDCITGGRVIDHVSYMGITKGFFGIDEAETSRKLAKLLVDRIPREVLQREFGRDAEVGSAEGLLRHFKRCGYFTKQLDAGNAYHDYIASKYDYREYQMVRKPDSSPYDD